MKCDAWRPMLEDFVEGELEGRLAQEVTAHLAVCASCSQLYGSFKREQELYGQYLLDVDATPALWANLQLELEKEKITRASRPLFRFQHWLASAFESLHLTPVQATALVLITIGLTVGIMVRRTGIEVLTNTAQNTGVGRVQSSPEVNSNSTDRALDNTDYGSSASNDHGKINSGLNDGRDSRAELRENATRRTPRRITVKHDSSPLVPTVDQVARKVEQQYLAAIEILARDAESRRAFITPARLSRLKTALAEVDRTINATRRAMREQPRDPVAVQYMTIAYEKKVELLREAVNR